MDNNKLSIYEGMIDVINKYSERNKKEIYELNF